ncbi:succinate-semialdehyde dehydrogenase [Sulfodiicoccus acidiphilus]|uniref:Succinate-semialdehyde dehydrogenase n=1 Tax=Sulfodiicoccus acidiphilus TaxID=1670455 RepID=A0A348B6K3_9CREN|nr:aldehyde dehydrogenase family protein [Sulfodiicoccus acidiphilus]BBD73805.1 succinate-semialdehyde dehydrogenase [Sulfodiicoccus acidiphilus]GGU03605.1 succinate-semialdehyde dehydrogenase [Sulfodiicoccus acidiphilus]
MAIKTINPYTGEILGEYQEDSLASATAKIDEVRRAQREWRKDVGARLEVLREVRKRLEAREKEVARLMTMEMGKPISQSLSEVKKDLWLMDYMIENVESMLAPEHVKTEAFRSYVRFDPLGVVLLVMPWNFPTWQVMRAAVPALLAGNGVVLKHASIVTGTSLFLQEIFDLPVFRSLVMRGGNVEPLIEKVDGVSFTGSTPVGAKIGEIAGRHVKKVVLELGGSDPFIVLPSADLESTVRNAVFARLQNNGQSCIASKRFIVHSDVYEEFREMLLDQFREVKSGDPLREDTFLGPLSSSEQYDTVRGQVDRLRKVGKVVEAQDLRMRNFVPPTVVESASPFNEEVFGPVALLKEFRRNEEAVELANDTPFGLGASIWGDPEEAERLIPDIEAGMVFVNKVVASDPRLPFGGVKKSGVGRELSRFGLLEFTNVKSVWVQPKAN